MHITSVRFTDDVWAQITEQAEALQISRSVFIREATIARVAQAPALAMVDELGQRVERLERALAEGR